jgi:hypothetical protein
MLRSIAILVALSAPKGRSKNPSRRGAFVVKSFEPGCEGSTDEEVVRAGTGGDISVQVKGFLRVIVRGG